MEYLAGVGGGLGDVFTRLYHHSQYQVLPLMNNRIVVDCLVTSCNPASKSVIESMLTEDGHPLFRDVICRDMFFPESPEGVKWLNNRRKERYLFLNEEQHWQDVFHGLDNIYQYGFYHGILYHHRYGMTYQEQTLFNELKENRYIVIHPSGGLQAVDGLTRVEYEGLIRLLLDTFTDITFITIGACHSRDWTDVVRRNNITSEHGFDIQHNRFIDLTNKTSGALCANIVENAIGFIGSHSSWMNMFWHFRKPNICVLSNNTQWGDAENYVKTNGCKWGFDFPYTKVVPVIGDIEGVYNQVIESGKGFIDVY